MHIFTIVSGSEHSAGSCAPSKDWIPDGTNQSVSGRGS